jgi:hypothetical protein
VATPVSIAGNRCESFAAGGIRRRLAFVCILLACSWVLVYAGPVAQTVSAQEAVPSEHQVKAVWLLNFARFVEWPATAFPNATAPLVVGVVGKDPFGRELERAFAGKTVKGRSFEFRRISNEADLHGCHIMFVPSSERKRTRDWTGKLQGKAVLTVGESEEFLQNGGVINFLLKDNTVRFEISLNAAQSARLKLHANLLKVAVAVQGKYD